MKIKLTRTVEYYEVIIHEGEEDPGKYIVRREPLDRLDIRYQIEDDKSQDYGYLTRPYKNITREMEKAKKNKKALLLQRQGRFIENQIEEEG